MRDMRYFLLIAFVLLGGLGYKTYQRYQTMQNTQQKLWLKQGKTLSKFILAFRDTYQEAFLTHHIPLDNRTLNLLPVKTIGSISKKLSGDLDNGVEIRTVSDRPRNPTNQANDFEQQMMDWFRHHPDQDEDVVNRGDDFYYLRPLRVTSTCLQCHGKREAAPPAIRSRYYTAYDYKLGDVRGLTSVRIAKNGVAKMLFTNFVVSTITMLFLYMMFMAAIYVLIRKMNAMRLQYARNLERDIAEKTEALTKQKDAFETLFEKSSDGIIILEDYRIIQCNEKAIDMFGHVSKDDLVGMRLSGLSPDHQSDGRPSLEKGDAAVEVAYAHGYHQFEWTYTRRDGTMFLADVTMTPIVLEGREVLYVVVHDISEKKEAEIQLREQKNALYHQAHHDALTHLPNRTLLLDRLNQEIKRIERDQTTLVLFFIDVDDFKKINDTLGHPIGDKVLIRVAEYLASPLQDTDTLARIGGDEFVIMTECSGSIDFTSDLAQKILDLFQKPMTIEGHTLYLSLSIGISLFPQDASSVDDLLKYGDAAMYAAKNSGKNRYHFYAPTMTRLLMERVTLEQEMRHAMETEAFCVHYQPQVEATTGRVMGLEALIRWEHPEKGMIPPGTFIPLAEETGLVVEIDRWVMRTAMRQVRAWREEGLDPGILSLNLTVQQLMSDDFISVLESEMMANTFAPEWLKLEILEREVMTHPDRSIQRLTQLSTMGIGIAIDDFGTGHSSLSYLKQLPLDAIKIDRSFIQGIVTNADDDSIIKAVIALAKSLNLNVIAEGVETREQVDFLVANGCTNIQGYFFARPMSAEAMHGMLTTQNMTE